MIVGRVCYFIGILFLFLITPRPAVAEEIKATPNRPGVADPAAVTQQGVLELEYGFARSFRSRELRTLSAASGLLRFGLTDSLELRLEMDSYLSQKTDERQGRRSGAGDTAPGFKCQILEEHDFWPALAFGYELKLPTASRKKGLGSGRVDHTLAFLATRDLFGWEWEASYFLGWLGKEGKRGFDDSHLFALSATHELFGPLALSGEVYAGPRVNRETPAIVSTDWALSYAVTPRLIFDVGVDIGLNAAAPNVTYFGGVTVALIDIYRLVGLKK
jgi:hypothetical protein